jgi:DNA repair exonuclease SbcCD nuclease subunit
MSVHPIAVLISDCHFTPATLDVATDAFVLAQNKAKELGVKLLVCGDTLDTKAVMRAECVNRLIELIDRYPYIIFLVGNHDRINEKSLEHSLNFIPRVGCGVINEATTLEIQGTEVTFVPYQTDAKDLENVLNDNNTASIVVAHQGIKGSNSGHYFSDHSAIDAAKCYGRRIISGHYHTRQTIELEEGGQWDYIGNPYTLNFGEALDPAKGFQVLYNDGSLEFIATNLRKHIVREVDFKELEFFEDRIKPGDLVWLKVRGSRVDLSTVNRADLIAKGWPVGLKLDLIYTDQPTKTPISNLSQSEALDAIIDNMTYPQDQKDDLKKLWRNLV